MTYWKFLYKFAIEFLTVFIWLIGKRFKKHRVYFLIILYLGIEALFVLQSYHVNTLLADDDPNRNIEIIMTYVGTMSHGLASIVLLTPSLAFTLIY